MANVVIDGVEYAPVNKSGNTKIVILQRGWVMVGDFTQDGDTITLRNARVIRLWGTTKGLGEIALGGPTTKTILEPCGTVTIPVLTTVAMIDCEADKWPRQ